LGSQQQKNARTTYLDLACDTTMPRKCRLLRPAASLSPGRREYMVSPPERVFDKTAARMKNAAAPGIGGGGA
jgi:hypothetical protein